MIEMGFSNAPLLANVAAQAAEQATGVHPLVTVLAFIGMLVVLVFVHELGHFLMALWMGIRVEEFGIGFPPRAVKLFEHRGVSYTLNWIPLGGFVRFGGEDNVYSGGRTSTAPEDGEDQSAHDTALTQAPPWRKIPVMVAGPFANLLMALVIFAIMIASVGLVMPTGKGQQISIVYPDTPAAEAGLQAGDVVVSIEGQSVNDVGAISEVARENSSQPLTIVIERDGERMELTATPGPWSVEGGPSSEMGFGFGYMPDVEEVKTSNPFVALWAGVLHTWNVLGLMLNGLGQMIGGLVGANEPPPGGIAGPVGIARATGEVIDAGGFSGFWNWMAIISLNLFVLNLLPIPALDGSHIVFSLLEWVRGGKKIPPEKEAMVHAIGFATLMGLIVLVSVSDVWNAINGVPVIGQ